MVENPLRPRAFAAAPGHWQARAEAAQVAAVAEALDLLDDERLAREEEAVIQWLQERAAPLLANPRAVPTSELEGAIAEAVRQRRLRKAEADLIAERVRDTVVGPGPLARYFRDPAVTEIMVVGRRVFVERDGRVVPALPLSSDDAAIRLAQHLARAEGREYHAVQPLLNFVWTPTGARINITHHAVAPSGVVITIRKKADDRVMGLPELVARRMLSAEAARFLVDAVAGRLNVVIAGPPGAGKTALFRAVAREAVHPRERVVVLEDIPELRLPLPHVVSLVGQTDPLTPAERAQGRVALLDLFRNALRQRYDRLFLGELRGPEAFVFLDAALASEGGLMTTIHLHAPELLVPRLVWIAQTAGLGYSADLIAASVQRTVHLVVQVDRDGTGHRHVSRIVENRPDGTVAPLFVWTGTDWEPREPLSAERQAHCAAHRWTDLAVAPEGGSA